MLSEGTYGEIARLTDWATRLIGVRQVMERVTVIRAHMQLCAGSGQPGPYEEKLILSVHGLAALAKQHQQHELAVALEALVVRMDQERDPSP
jgi:hypothetical protein